MVKDPQDTSAHQKAHFVCLGAIAGAHGVRGEMRVKTFTQNPLDIAAYGTLTSEDGARNFVITKAVPDKIGARVRIDGIAHRDQAEALKGTRLYVARTLLPTLESGDDFYHDDLIGLQANTLAGDAFGQIVAVHDFGAGDLLEIKTLTDAGEDVEFIPFTKKNVPHIDLTSGQVTIVPPIMADMSDMPDNNGAD